MRSLPEFEQRRDLSDVISRELLTAMEYLLGTSSKAVLQGLCLKWAEDAQTHGAGNQPAQM